MYSFFLQAGNITRIYAVPLLIAAGAKVGGAIILAFVQNCLGNHSFHDEKQE